MLIAVMYFFVKMIRYTMLFWLPLYMTEQLGLARAEAGYTSALYESIGFLGVPLAGMISDRFMGARRYPVGAMMLWGLAIACFLYPVLGAYGRWGNIIGIGLLGILTFGPDALMSGPAVQDCVPAGQTGAAAGFVNGIGSIGQQISPLLVSYVTQWFGWGVLFQIFGLMAVAAGLCLAPRWNWRPALAAAPGGLRAAQA
jgi:sugar phosphate permease